MKITGQTLKAARSGQNLKISDISFALKISSKIIQSIEDGDSQSLPAKTFLRGFVKSYAEYLKLDSDLVLKKFQEEMGSTNPVPKVPPPKSAEFKAEVKKEAVNVSSDSINGKINIGLTQRHIFIFIFVSICVGFLAIINSLANRYTKEHTEVAIQKISNLAINKDLPISSITSAEGTSNQKIAATTVPNQTVPINNLAEVKKEAGATEASENQTSKINPAVEYPAMGISAGKAIEIMIEAKKDITVEYTKGNSMVFEKILIKENSYQIIRSTNGLHLRTENGASLILTVNGILKPAYKPKPLQLTF